MVQVDAPSGDPVFSMEGVSEQIITQIKDPVDISRDEPTPVTILVSNEEASHYCSLHESKEDSGAGANANSSTKVIVNVTTNPLSELVWSPNGGLGIKYSECRLSERISSILWNTETANMIVLPPQSIKDPLHATGVKVSDGILSVRQPECDLKVKCHGEVTSCRSQSEVAKIAYYQLRSHCRLLVDAEQYCAGATKAAAPGFDTNDGMGTSCSNEAKDSTGLYDGRTTNLSIEKVAENSIIPMKLKPGGYYEECQNVDCCNVQEVGTSSICPSGSLKIKEQHFLRRMTPDQIMAKDNKIKISSASASCTGFPHLSKLEFVDENILKSFKTEDWASQGNTKPSPLANAQYHKNGDEKALMRTEVGPNCSEGKDDSTESAESSSSKGLLSSRKRACSSEPQCTSINKKVKTQQSSFVNWISSVKNGILKAEQDGILSLTDKTNKQQTRDRNRVPDFASSSKNQASTGTLTGFQKFFEDIAGTRLRLQKERTEQGSQKTEQRDLVLCNTQKTDVKCDKDDVTSPLSLGCFRNSFREGGDPCDKVFYPNVGENPSPLSPHVYKSGSPDKKIKLHTSVNRANQLKRAGAALSSCKTLNSWKGCINQIPIVDEVASSSRVPYDINKQIDIESENEVGNSDQDVSLSRNSQNPVSPAVVEPMNVDQKLKTKLNLLTPSQKFRSSEGMSSLFARRLDALKHIATPNSGDNIEYSKKLCFFCGIKGHILQHCNHILEPEQDDIRKKLNLSNEVEDASCFCIRCFQLNHWAIACPRV